MKRHTITRLATPSIAESIPKPIRAIEPATIPAVIAIAPSAPIQTRLSQESCFAPARPPQPIARSAALARRFRWPRNRWERDLAHAVTRSASATSTSSRPRSVSEYMTILPSRRLVASPAERSWRR